LVAKGNKEFLSNHQQDALEYLQILFSFIQKGEKQENLHSLINLFEHK
jgi:ubiquitin carboxyl-terminal hydrolase 5/13